MKMLLLSVNYNLNDLNIGLNSIHSALLVKGHQSHFLTIPSRQKSGGITPGLIRFIERIEPDLIGCSLHTNEFDPIKTFSSVMKGKFPDIPIIWGGVHPTMHPESCFPYTDYVCIGEGEQTILEIAKCVDNREDFRKTRNLCYKKDGKLIKNPLYQAIENLDDFPFPEFLPANTYVYYRGKIQALDKTRYANFARYGGRVLHALSSRGCPFECSYCCNSFYLKLYGKKLRTRTVENLIRGIQEQIRKHKEIKWIFFYDENFLAHDSTYIRKFCDLYREKISKPFTIMSTPIYISKERIQMLKDAGLMFVQSGLQTGSDRIAKDVFKRKSLRKDFIRAMHILKDDNIPTSVDVILDNPFENESDTIRTILTLAKVPKPFNGIFFSLTFFHGTEICHMAESARMNAIRNPVEKNSLECEKNVLNEMAKLAVYLDEVQVERMIRQYLRAKDKKRFTLYLLKMKVLSYAIYQPYWDLCLLYNASGANLLKMLINFRFLLSEWFRRRFIWNL